VLTGKGVALVRDIDIRRALHRAILLEHSSDPSTVVVDELGILQGSARVDIAVVNNQLAAFEIKSERDTLERLPRQVDLYSRVFDFITIVSSDSHLHRALEIVPAWWGVAIATEQCGALRVTPYREARSNQSVDPLAVVELLWRDEALALLAARGADRGYRSRPRRAIWERVCEVYTIQEIKDAVRRQLKERLASRAVQLPG
jgi:hypothetical protein